jgi:hypothetical protein
MLSSARKVLVSRRVIALILIVIIAVPITVFVHAELAYGSYNQEPTHSVMVYSLKDIWYPNEGSCQLYPLFIVGNISSYYSRPYLMYPSNIEFEFLMKDNTNLTADLSWLMMAGYDIISEGTYINVTLNPNVNGDYGDAEGYVANQSEWTSWYSKGLSVINTSIGAGISSHDLHLTGYRISHYYSFCKVGVSFGLDTSLRSVSIGLLLEFPIFREEASQIAEHWMEIIVAYTITWTPILILELSETNLYSDMIFRGDGLADEGMVDYTFYMLEGNITIRQGQA